jgi:CzcA family heavy metal efflux pump
VSPTPWLLRHRRFVLGLALLLATAGLLVGRDLPVSLLPEVDFPRVGVSVEAGDRPADRTAIEVTQPIEEAIRGVVGVRRVRSQTSRGACDLSVDFAWGSDMVAATLQVQAAITRILPDLPAGVGFEARRMDPTVFPVLGLSVSSSAGRSGVELRDLARYELGPRLSAIGGVAKVGVLGGERQEIQILVDPVRLEALGLSLDDVLSRVSAANVVRAVGRLEQDEKLFLVVSDSRFDSGESFAGIVLRSDAAGEVRLGDVAELRDAAAPAWVRVTADGREAALLEVFQQPGASTLRVAHRALERAQNVAARFAPDVHVAVWYDQSELVRGAVASVRDAIGFGALLAIAVLAVFLGSWRVTLTVVLILPLVLATTLLGLRVFGLGLDLMTLGGLAAAVGLVIDDAIVIVEHALRRVRETGEQGLAAFMRAAWEMRAALAGSSIASLVIFAPLAFLSGVTGAFFRALSLTMAMALGLSFLAAMLVIPLLGGLLLRPGDVRAEDLGPRFARIRAGYERWLGAALARPWLLLPPVLCWLALAGVAYWRLGSGFLPVMDEGGFVLDYVTPPGTSLTETDRRLGEIERILKEEPDVRTVSRRTGLQLGGFLTEANEGDFFVRLVPPPRRTTEQVIDHVRERIGREVPGVEVEFVQLIEDVIGDLTGVPQPVEVKLFGADVDQLRAQAARVAEALESLPHVVDVKPGVVLAGDALDVRVSPEKAAWFGLDADRVTRLVSIALQGALATPVVRGPKLVDVRLWTPPELRGDVDRLRRLRIRSDAGAEIALGRVADVTEDIGQPQITREDLQTLVAVTARISGGDLGSVMRDVRRTVGALEQSNGIHVGYGGLYQEQRASFVGLARVLAAAVALVSLLLLALYEEVRVVCAILGATILSGAGVSIGLWLSGSELNVASLMGLTMIVGITAESAIFFVSRWQEAGAGLEPRLAVLEAGRTRLRPILMTGLAAILALLPLAIGVGSGAGMLQPLAIAIISGLLAGLPAVTLVMPALLPRRSAAQ